MSDDENPLSGRFEQHAPGSDNARDTNDPNDTRDSEGADSVEQTAGADGEETVRERKQEAMYLKPSQREELRNFYDELDARSKLNGDGGLAKNDDFYESLVNFVLEERRDEFVEFMGLDPE